MSNMLRAGSEAVLDRSGLAAPVVDLRATVRDHVIPRLCQGLQSALRQPRHHLVKASPPTLNEMNALASSLLANDLLGAIERVDVLRKDGRTLEQIYLTLLVPTACHLRDLSSEDFCGLAEVTIAFCNLQSLLRHYGPAFYGEACRQESGQRALLVSPSPGDPVVGLPLFGLLLMSEFFRREGWDAWVERSLSSGNFSDTVLSEWFDLVEVLATSDTELDQIASGIRLIRRGSLNPAIGVIVCGDVFRDHPEFVRMVGADVMASDPLSSLSQANKLTQAKQLAQSKQLVTRSAPQRRLV